MAVRVTYVSGPNAGTEISIPADKQSIRFGRGIECDVGFPEEFNSVGHEHFALQKSLDGYKFEIRADRPVFINDHQAHDGERLRPSQKVKLVDLNGPELAIDTVDPASHPNWLKTAEPHKPMTTVWQIARETRSGMITLGAVGAIAVLAGVSGYWLLSNRATLLSTQQTLLSDRTEFVASQQGKLASILKTVSVEANFQPVFDAVWKSVFLVEALDGNNNSISTATAWVVQTPDGPAFATNVHVAELFDEARFAQGKLVVRSPDTNHAEYEISDVKKHPGWYAFRMSLADARSQWGTPYVRRFKTITAYDVALLIPNRRDGLPAPLKLATSATVQALHGGEPVAFVGYPSENLIALEDSSPTPQKQMGIITATSNFFMVSDKPGENELLHHNLAATGGASGSPILNASGEVVGLLNAGNVAFLATPRFDPDTGEVMRDDKGKPLLDFIRMPNAASVNFGQRVDLLAEIIDGTADARMKDRAKIWDEQLRHFQTPLADIVRTHVTAFERENSNVTVAAEQKGRAENRDDRFGGFAAAVVDLTFEANTNYLITASAPENDRTAQLSAYLYRETNGKRTILQTKQAEGPIVQLEQASSVAGPVHLAIVSIATDSAGKAIVRPADFSLVVHQGVKPPS